MTGPEAPRLSALHGTYLARVVDVKDPDGMSRVGIRLMTTPETIADADAMVWARVAVPFAGSDRGSFFLPDVGDEVAVVFINGDSRQPIVVGSLWNGSAHAPEKIAGDRVDRWTIVGKRGSRFAIVEHADGQAEISIRTPGAESITLKQTGGGEVVLDAAGNRVTMNSGGITMETPYKASISAGSVEVNAAEVKVNAIVSTFAGIVKCEVLQTGTCISATYTPGAGNIW